MPVEDFKRLASQGRGEVDQIVDTGTLLVKRRRLRRKRLGGGIPLARNVADRHRSFLDRPDGLARRPIEDVGERLFAHRRDRLNRPPVDLDVDHIRRRRKVVVPDAVVHGLEVPHPPAGACIETDDGLGKQIVAGPIAPVVVIGRRRQRHIDIAQLFVRGGPGPHVGVAAVLPGGAVLVQRREPRLVARLPFPRDRVKAPELLARAHIEATDVARGHLFHGRHRRVCHAGDGRADDDHVVHDDRGRPPSERIDVTVVVALRQIDLAPLAEVGVTRTGLGVHRHQIGSDHRDDTSVGTLGVVPIGHPPGLAHTLERLAVAVGWQVVPHHFTGGGIQRCDGPQPGADVEPAVGHQWGVLGGERGAHFPVTAYRVGEHRLPPHDLEIVKVVGVDLIQR